MISADIVLSYGTDLKQTEIQPFERLVIFFDSIGKNTEEVLQAKIDHANKIYNKEMDRKILLIM